MKDFLARFEKLLEYTGGSAYRLANEIGSSEAVISNIRAGKTKPSYDFLSKLLNKYKVIDLNWLMTGEGEMIKNYTHTPTALAMNEPENDFIKQIPHETYGSSVTDVVTNQLRKRPKSQEKYENRNVQKCEKCDEKERVINALEGRIKDLGQVVQGKEELVREKERYINRIEEENARLSGLSGKQKNRAG